MQHALVELQSGKCDFIRGFWRERVSRDGSPIDIVLSNTLSLDEQFPYSCAISAQFMPLRTTWKVLVYRASYRVSFQLNVF